MSVLTINCITDWSSDDSDGPTFDEVFGEFQQRVHDFFESMSLPDELSCVYVQFQYDCRTLPSTVAGTKIGRYSKKHRDIQAYVEVTRAQFQACESHFAFLLDLLTQVLRQIEERVDGGIRPAVASLVSRVEGLSISE